MKVIFLNTSNQLRSGWKLILVTIIACIFMIISVTALEKCNMNDKYGITMFVSFVISVLIMLKFIDKKELGYIGIKSLKYYYKDLILGLIIGAVLVTLNVILLLLTGDASFSSEILNINVSNSLLKGFLILIVVGFAEETLFRGYFIMTLQQMGKWWISILFSSIIFALLHGGLNDNVTYIGVVNILLAAILLGYMFIKTQSIWMPVGLHITWNYFQGYIFGVQVSGRALGEGLYTLNAKDTIMTGGDFGLEGGLANTIVLVAALILMCIYFKKKQSENKTSENL